MISWIQKNLQQHYRIVFGILLVLIIVSFVFITNASSGFGRADQRVRNTPFFDRNLGVKQDVEKIYRDAQIAIELQFGMPAGSVPQFDQFALSRYAGLYMANQLRVPEPTKFELEQHIKTLRVFAGENGEFDASRYAEFRAQLGKNGGPSQADVLRVLADDVRIERVTRLIVGPGYTLPSDVKRELALADTSWTLATATIDRSSFTPTITPTESDLTRFFEENALRYTIPAQVSVRYAAFAADNYQSVLPAPSEQEIRNFYDSNPTRFPVPERKAGELPNPDADFAAVRADVEKALKNAAAARVASKAADDFAVAIYEKKITANSPELDQLLAQFNVTLKDTPPFSYDNVPAELGRNPAIPAAALRLNAERPVSEAIPTETGSVVLFWQDTIPSRQPDFAEVRDRVSADYIAQQKDVRFAELGRTLRSGIESRMKAGESFDKAASAAAAAASVKVETKTLPAFTLRQPPQDFDPTLYRVLQDLEQGQVSEMATAADKGVIAYAQAKTLPDLSDANPQYAELRKRIAQTNASANGYTFFQQLVQQELAKSGAMQN